MVIICVEFYHYFFLKKAVEYMYLLAYKCSISERIPNKLVYIGSLWEEELKELSGRVLSCISSCATFIKKGEYNAYN